MKPMFVTLWLPQDRPEIEGALDTRPATMDIRMYDDFGNPQPVVRSEVERWRREGYQGLDLIPEECIREG